jgi:hypothetical protein
VPAESVPPIECLIKLILEQTRKHSGPLRLFSVGLGLGSHGSNGWSCRLADVWTAVYLQENLELWISGNLLLVDIARSQKLEPQHSNSSF